MLLTTFDLHQSVGRQFCTGGLVLGAALGLAYSMGALPAKAQEVKHEDPIVADQAEVKTPQVPAAAPAAVRDATEPTAVSAKVVRYAQRIIDRHDRNRDGRLQVSEWQSMRGSPSKADRDGDGVVERDEMIEYVAEYGRERRIRLLPPPLGDLAELPPLLHPTTAGASEEEPAGEKVGATERPQVRDGLPGDGGEAVNTESAREDLRRRDTKFYAPASRVVGVPAAFLSRDRDGDGQLTLPEFAPKKDRGSLEEFSRHDRNGDGVITVAEYLGRSGSPAKIAEEPKKQE